ncbi:Lpp/OprI family alanine-zipper lipoprotein [Pseudomonas sp. P2757]|uniref:Lpp/OprI family alanine-zipper lipoprotein n=1 Tax=unclassified Pseudomonas TaxID=196821 RepID=UPI003B5C739C
MRQFILPCLLIVIMTATAGCSHRRQEIDARLSGAEDMATAARVHSDASALKADQALRAALDAKKSADEANERAQLLLKKAGRAN